MMSSERVLGVIAVMRNEEGQLPAHQIQLLQSFADQAVIAIENARLFNETQEALERQTATAEILKVIAASPSDAQPVFDAIAESAKRLLGGYSATVARVVGDWPHLTAFTLVGPAADEALKAMYPVPRSPLAALEDVMMRQGFLEAADTESDLGGALRDAGRARGYRGLVMVPLKVAKSPSGSCPSRTSSRAGLTRVILLSCKPSPIRR